MRKTGTGVLAGMMMTAAVFGNDWPQFCGPTRNNISTETGLAKSWPKDGPEVLWTVDVSTGFAGPAVKDGVVYLMENDGTKSSIHARALDSGKELWVCSFDDPGTLKNEKFPGARGTPTVTDDSLYAVTLLGTAVGIDLKTHQIKWKLNFVKDYDKKLDGWGVAQAPLLYGNLVILAPMTKTGSMVAVDKDSGKEVWKVTGFFSDGFVSPQLFSIDDEDQILMVSAGSKPEQPSRRPKKEAPEEETSKEPPRPTYVFAVSPKDGKVLWSYDGWFCSKPIPSPVLVNRNTLFITGGYKAVSQMLEVKKNEGSYAMKELLKTEAAAVQIEQPVFVNDHLFVGGTVKKPSRGLVCMDLNGKVKWDTNEIQGAPVYEHINMIAVDGMLIGLDGDTGTVNLIEATPTAFNLLASAKVLAEKGQTWGPMALSDGKLLVRDHKVMKCLQLK